MCAVCTRQAEGVGYNALDIPPVHPLALHLFWHTPVLPLVHPCAPVRPCTPLPIPVHPLAHTFCSPCAPLRPCRGPRQSNYYVIGRRLRETLKSQALNPLRRARGPLGVLPLDAVDTAEAKVESRLARGMAALAWVPGCSEHHAVWAALATGYAKWWLGRVRAAGALTEALLGEVENTFASSLVRYFTQGGRPVTFEPYLTPGDATAPSS